MDKITQEKLDKYFKITGEALELAKKSKSRLDMPDARADFINMIQSYVSDAKYFEKKGDKVLAFAALNYAHGWLDAGARIGLFDVNDSRLFTVDSD